MKTLSLWQPWATLMAIGKKTVETRHWQTKYRGPLAIHAAKRKNYTELRLHQAKPAFAAAFETVDQMPFGCIVAVIELIDCLETTEALKKYGDVIAAEIQFGDYSPGRFAWVTRFVRKLDPPIACNGSQGFFEVPDTILRPPPANPPTGKAE